MCECKTYLLNYILYLIIWLQESQGKLETTDTRRQHSGLDAQVAIDLNFVLCTSNGTERLV